MGMSKNEHHKYKWKYRYSKDSTSEHLKKDQKNLQWKRSLTNADNKGELFPHSMSVEDEIVP